MAAKSANGVDGLDLSLHKLAFEDNLLQELAPAMVAKRRETLDSLAFEGDLLQELAPAAMAAERRQTLDSLAFEGSEQVEKQSRSNSPTGHVSPAASRAASLKPGRRATIQEMNICLICDEKMNFADLSHPPQCTNACGFNFCNTCIQSLIISNRDDFGLASDGSMRVKVYLLCPNCRSDLSSTIRDTVILRKADRIEIFSGEGDEELTESELRMRDVMDDEELRDAIAEARKREAEFFGRKCEDEDEKSEKGTAAAEQELITNLLYKHDQRSRFPRKGAEEFEVSEKQHTDVESGHKLPELEFDTSSTEQDLATEPTESEDANMAAAAKSIDKVIQITGTGQGARKKRENARVRSSVFVLIDEAKKVRERKANLKKKDNGMKVVREQDDHSPAFCCFG